MQKPLDGLRVVEVSSGVAGAYAGRVLAQLGADVCRAGAIADLAVSATTKPYLVAWLHEHKRDADPDALLREIDRADLLIVEDSYGADDLVAQAVARAESGAPAVPCVRVAATISSSGLLPGNALTSTSWAAINWVLGEPDRKPLTLPFNLPDYQAGVQAAAAGLALVVGRPGMTRADVACRDIMAYYAGMGAANYIPYERRWHRSGARPFGSAGVYPVGNLPCKDGWVAVMIRNQVEWDKLRKAMGDPEWARDPRFADPREIARLHADEADTHFLPWLTEYTETELYDLAVEHGIAISPIKHLPQALDEPQLGFRDFLDTVDGSDGPVATPTVPWKLTEGPDVATPKRQWPLVEGCQNQNPRHLFSGLRVLDLSWVWSGPMVTSMLADMGADIIKVEHGGHLDTGRLRGKARRNGAEVDGPDIEATPYFNQMNHGKRGTAIDLKSERGRRLVLELAAECDVVVENMRPGALAQLGLTYEEFAESNPSITMLSMSMAGQEGPLRALKGYAGIMTAISGIDALVGYPEGGAPVGTQSTALGDPNAAGHAFVALLALLFERKRSGRGGWIDLSQVEAAFAVMCGPIIQSQLEGSVSAPGTGHPDHTPHGTFACRGEDRWVAIAVRSDTEWLSLLEVLDLDEASRPPEHWTLVDARLAAGPAVEQWLDGVTRRLDRDELATRLLEVGIAAAPVADYDDLVASTWSAERQLSVTVNHKYLGPVEAFVLPWQVNGRPLGVASPAPLLGQDTHDVLANVIGMDAEAVADLKAQNVLW